MLESLTIRRIALIDEATICFHGGMQVLTGETGAGKSIVVDSVNLVLGGRADREMIRSGFEKGSVEAVFLTAGNPGVLSFMEQEGIEWDGETVTVYREITAGGRNTCRVCGVLLPLSKLKELAELLLDLHGQNEHQFLADPERHLEYLDQTGGEEHRKLLEKAREDCAKFIENHRAYAALVKKNENREARMASLERDMEELRKARIETGEEAALSEKRKHLVRAEKQIETLNSIRDLLSSDTAGGSALSRVKEASAALKALAGKDESFTELSARCESLYLELEETAYQVSLLTSREDYEPGTLEKTDNRLDLIHRLERKYGKDADGLPGLLSGMEEEYRELAGLEKEAARMSAEHKRLLGIYRNTARELTASRKQLASEFEKRMMKELNDLGMGSTVFSVEFRENETGRPIMPSPAGDDRIEFMISPNPGEPLKSLAKIASGGELSRLMLAMKTLETARSGVESMVFDEIDTGISGRMAQVVAEKMITISREKQVICVTHLPQIAAAADYQFLVEKNAADGRTVTSVTELNGEGRTAEVSRMISGAGGVTDESNAYAARMLRAAEELKNRR